MTYRAEFDGAALVQLNGLPSAAFDALVARVVTLVQEPWDADLLAPGGDRPIVRCSSARATAYCRSMSTTPSN